MNKLEMAHEYAKIIMTAMLDGKLEYRKPYEIANEAFSVLDAMLVENGEREVSIAELMKDHVHDYIYGRICACGAVNGAEKEWQPDSVPEKILKHDAWRKSWQSENIKPSLLKDEISGFFINIETNDVIYSESDIISHDWRRIADNVDFVALRLIDSKMFFCVASEVDEDKFKVIWKRPQ